MPSMTHEYLSILRCRTYCVWPEWVSFETPSLRTRITTDGKDVEVDMKFSVTTYEARPRPEISPPQAEGRKVSPIIWRGLMGPGYWLGEALLKAPEEKITVELEHEHALQGEIDIKIHLKAPSELQTDILRKELSTLSLSLASYVNVALGDYMVPVAPISVSERNPSGAWVITDSHYMFVRNRGRFSEETLQAKLTGLIEKRMEMQETEGKAFDVAARRYLTSLTETDPIDKFCDLWETCEFLVSEAKAKGDIVSRIAKALAHHMCLSKKLVENRLDIRGLYRIRKDIVHNAKESLPDLMIRIRLIDKIACELIKNRLRLPYEGCPPLDDLLKKPPETR